jgi:hypothetical protein
MVDVNHISVNPDVMPFSAICQRCWCGALIGQDCIDRNSGSPFPQGIFHKARIASAWTFRVIFEARTGSANACS